MTDEYSLIEHKHRFAAWAASRAARVKRFPLKVSDGRAFLDQLGLREYVEHPDELPGADDVDAVHLDWRTRVVRSASKRFPECTHGTAAKLINVYLKAAFVCGGFHDHPKVAPLHPPIDRLLLDELARKDVGGQKAFWRQMRDKGWSSFDSPAYQRVIDRIRHAMAGSSLWEVERYWRGYR